MSLGDELWCVYRHVCLGACVSMNKRVCVKTSMCECEYVCVCVCVCMCMCWGQGLWQRVQPETGHGGSWALLFASDDISGHQEPVL